MKKGCHTDKQEYENHTRSIGLSEGHDLAVVKGRQSKDNPHLTGGIGMLRTGDRCSNRPTGYRNGNRPMLGRRQRDGGGPSGTIWHMGEQSTGSLMMDARHITGHPHATGAKGNTLPRVIGLWVPMVAGPGSGSIGYIDESTPDSHLMDGYDSHDDDVVGDATWHDPMPKQLGCQHETMTPSADPSEVPSCLTLCVGEVLSRATHKTQRHA